MDDDVVVGRNWKMSKKIRDGSEIYEGVDIHSGEEVAIKREPVRTKRPQLLNESIIYEHLQGTHVGIPSLKWFGVEDGYRFLVIQRLGPSLEDLLKRSKGGRFTLKTVLMLADQIIPTLRHMHSKGVIHRDIKPEHLLMGVGSNASKVYLIDFGLANFFRDRASGEHIPHRENVSFVGTLHYASLYTHFGIEQSRRDDGESFFYVLMYLLQGSLPWQGLRAESNAKKYNEELTKYKFVYTEREELEKWCPVEIQKCLDLTRYITFYDTPAFLSIMVAFDELFKRKGYEFDLLYDWDTYPEEEDNIESGTSSEKPERILATQDSSSDDHSRNMISDDVSSSKVVSNDPEKRRRKNRRQRRSTAQSQSFYRWEVKEL